MSSLYLIINPQSCKQHHSSEKKIYMEQIKPLCFLPFRALELIAHLLEIEFPSTTAMFTVAMVWCADRKAENPIAGINLLRHIQDNQSVSGDDEEYDDDDDNMPGLVYATDEEEDDDNTIPPQLIDIRAPPNLNELVEFIPCSMHIEAAA